MKTKDAKDIQFTVPFQSPELIEFNDILKDKMEQRKAREDDENVNEENKGAEENTTEKKL